MPMNENVVSNLVSFAPFSSPGAARKGTRAKQIECGFSSFSVRKGVLCQIGAMDKRSQSLLQFSHTLFVSRMNSNLIVETL